MARFSTDVKAMSKRKSLLLQREAGPRGLFPALVRQVHVRPAGKQVFLIPDALSMTQ